MIENLTIKSVTSGQPVPVILVSRSLIREVFRLPSVLLMVPQAGQITADWVAVERWHYPADVIGLD
tara:strand:- start:246 stop:443 length:198 start_codon:yes stop_codon:yes gene_type:complete